MATPPKTRIPKLKILTSDAKIVHTNEAVARKFESIKNILDSGMYSSAAGSEIPVSEVTAKVLRRILEWCNRHVKAEAKAERKGKMTAGDVERLKKWDEEFVKGLGDVYILQVALAADRLGAKDLTMLLMDGIAESIGDNMDDSDI